MSPGAARGVLLALVPLSALACVASVVVPQAMCGSAVVGLLAPLVVFGACVVAAVVCAVVARSGVAVVFAVLAVGAVSLAGAFVVTDTLLRTGALRMCHDGLEGLH